MHDYQSLRLALVEMKGCCQDASKLGERCNKYGFKETPGKGRSDKSTSDTNRAK